MDDGVKFAMIRGQRWKTFPDLESEAYDIVKDLRPWE